MCSRKCCRARAVLLNRNSSPRHEPDIKYTNSSRPISWRAWNQPRYTRLDAVLRRWPTLDSKTALWTNRLRLWTTGRCWAQLNQNAVVLISALKCETKTTKEWQIHTKISRLRQLYVGPSGGAPHTRRPKVSYETPSPARQLNSWRLSKLLAGSGPLASSHGQTDGRILMHTALTRTCECCLVDVQLAAENNTSMQSKNAYTAKSSYRKISANYSRKPHHTWVR